MLSAIAYMDYLRYKYNMNIEQIEKNVESALKNVSKKEFIYDLLLAYGLPKSSITRLKQGTLNLSKRDDEISWKKKLLFREVFNTDLHVAISELRTAIKHKQRFIVITDYKTVLAIDTETEDKLDTPLSELHKHFDFFLPWAGMEKTKYQSENPVDVKAAERMARLYDEIIKDNPDSSLEFTHSLNVFLSRLLFCFFAEDTGIFEKGVFSYSIGSHTQVDGSDLQDYLEKLFSILDTPEKDREGTPSYMRSFPYVNGGLFKERLPIPNLSSKSRKAILESGTLDWAQIHPDIFGSMIQAVVSPEHRGGLGMHYTSVPNIMKLIEPLFLNDLYEVFERAKGNMKKLDALLLRIQNIKIFDPACGSGNFLIIAYKELRKLEIKVLKESGKLTLSQVQLSSFYGIELDDFAHEIAKLSLWLAEHQMNVFFFKEIGQTSPTLPLKEAGHIVLGNATRIDWNKVCPKEKSDEVYLLGNPPYLGSSVQNKDQKEDMKIACSDINGYKNLDYIACWLKKASDFIQNSLARFAFVSTNSICQGEQVALLWPYIYSKKLEIFFAHQPFKWSNNAKSNAAVICIILGVQESTKSNIKINKKLYLEDVVVQTKSIGPYLIKDTECIVPKRAQPISRVPSMCYGNKAADGGYLLLNDAEKEEILRLYPESQKYIRQALGSTEFINAKSRWCIWITDEDKEEAKLIDGVKQRIEKVRVFRLNSKKKATQKNANIAHKFSEARYSKKKSLIIPRVSSERRDYIPIGFLESDVVILDSAQAIYDPPTWIFSVLTSKMHMSWVHAVGGRLKTDYRYSSALCYNTFPFPGISEKKLKLLTQSVFEVLAEREKHPEKTLAQLYDPDKMPTGLREAHRLNDLAVDKCYRSTPFNSDEERLEHLFKLYEEMLVSVS